MDILSTAVKTAAQYCAEVLRCQKGSEGIFAFFREWRPVEKIEKS
jgi:hypothetical protein